MKSEIRLAVGSFSDPTPERLTYARQIGATGITLNTPAIPGNGTWEFAVLHDLRERVERHGLRLEAIENTPLAWYDKVMLGLPGRDRQIENYQETIRNVGRAGIPYLGYHWMPTGVWRTSREAHGRGDAQCTAFDAAQVAESPLAYQFGNNDITQANMTAVDPAELAGGHIISEEQMWENFTYFIRAVAPVAAESGVGLAMHPDDPPIPALGGIARIMRSPEAIQRAIDIEPSASNGLVFCVGTWAEMGVDTAELIGRFADQSRVFFCHFRDVQGSLPNFRETFHGEGDVDFPAVIERLHSAGFRGFVIDDHNPAMLDDTPWGHRARALSTGYIAGMLRVLGHNKLQVS